MIEPVALSTLTTFRLGGPPAARVAPVTEQNLINETLSVWGMDENWLLLGGGSNTVVADAGFDGIVIHVVTRGIEVLADGSKADAAADDPADDDPVAAGPESGTEHRGARVRLRVQAGEPWDDLVAYAVDRGWAGIEALSGIPGSCGAAPVQNIGAYGQELSDSLVAVDFLSYETGEVERLERADLDLGYRTSALKQGLRGVVLAIELELHDTAAEASVLGSTLGQPLKYSQLAGALGVQLGDRVPLQIVRATVLGLRAGKGMVLDPSDPDTFSAGSFFTNPIVTEGFARSLPTDAPRWPLEPEPADRVIPLEEYMGVGPIPGEEPVRLVKLSAAWLIEHAGVRRGFRLPGSKAAVSSKHTLALTNTGGATAAEVAELARYVLGRVRAEFGVNLQAEPVLVGLTL
ncbi:MAG: UDP-N-acetylmuramate dehydrogenase [Cryobacterium sp.]|uniref:UDP-N-acetylmuramate dehydrogenase n=1 Tax=unclassified Cryobacterium TaxID=2649013 RepID=UPI0018CB1C49|nr:MULTISPECIES: UDP-N-acetylmuramate dehydrogenase [unclassified Cryobacterium]MCY7403222.1 UDP-N-acetylmuramate dehydrogenase [Cryobacterium sp.]MEC5154531.1 UDP-N-acetylmuramate dehydrogenase [Cryobacterium sp. CAN_C3]